MTKLIRWLWDWQRLSELISAHLGTLFMACPSGRCFRQRHTELSPKARRPFTSKIGLAFLHSDSNWYVSKVFFVGPVSKLPFFFRIISDLVEKSLEEENQTCKTSEVQGVFSSILTAKGLSTKDKKAAIIDFIAAGIQTVSLMHQYISVCN